MLPNLSFNALNSTWGEISISYNNQKYIYPYYIPTGEVFNDDPSMLIRYKCAALVVFTPVITLIRTIYWAAKAMFLTLAAAFYHLNGNLTEQDKARVVETFKDCGRAWYYGAQMTLYAALGIILPYYSRLNYGHLEASLNRHEDGPHRDKFYLAICFQRLIVYDGDNLADVEQKLTNILGRIQALKTAFWSFSFQKIMKELNAIGAAATK